MILGLFLPTYLLSLFFAQNVYNQTRGYYLQTETLTLQKYEDQIESELNSFIRYLESRTLSDSYPGLSSSRSEVSYQLAKTGLWQDVSSTSTFFDEVDMIYAAFPVWDDCFALYQSSKISHDNYKEIKDYLKLADQFAEWQNIELAGERFFHYRVKGKFHMGILISEKTLLSRLEKEKGIIYEFTEQDKSQKKIKNDYAFASIAFLAQDRFLTEKIDILQLNNAIPSLYFWLFSVPLIGMLLVFLSLWILRKIVLHPVRMLDAAMKKTAGGQADYRIQDLDSSREFREIQMTYNEMMDNINDLTIETYELELENQQTQMINLQLQLNPHFLMNSMNTIYSLAEVERYDDIQPYVFNLINYLRYSIGNLEAEVELQKEIEFTEYFAAIQRMRFPNRFHLIYNYDEELQHEKILRLIIENLVENSIKHGAVRGRSIEIAVTVVKRDDRLIISVCDDGKGMPEQILQEIRAGNIIRDNSNNTHVGLWNCFRRLRLFYKDQAEWNITSKPNEGTQVYIEIPVMEAKHESDHH